MILSRSLYPKVLARTEVNSNPVRNLRLRYYYLLGSHVSTGIITVGMIHRLSGKRDASEKNTQ